ncbi:MAG: 16S rRNA (cytidine(1402)-2'-O)-methyltransferase [Ignavibacteriota bacterium]|nr:16S rRNA (cytidine(1402)-2'-O)-methyltransferase [Ignavibacteriota bacterium]MCO6447802.1 16S rRNA (cytidine(1402)-2'-O)-methyltransferase [Ignavibacterium album]MCZ2267771.1 16S rRNA (cytidine(1402)-2'-O)-methyltransferase [Ignavibacteriales bacterium]QKJ99161.1 MAG: 16S rRNA (cytidine(1402)-2'-O)-methyltransferase [Ignavibacteriota bacterium]HOJ08743.1 16S rRNA (cytidine(1402)-2'-O)-methyltransferase [Ignavibacteriaceae bacterium]
MKLYIVSTPIGNLKDITLRALETLKEVDFILCEDSRVSVNLLNHYGISKDLISLNAVNESHKIQSIITKLKSNKTGALISDAGTPLISDPGARLVSACLENEIEIIPIPGASAILSALCMSGLPTDSFVFDGFLPQKKGRQTKLKQLALEERTIILYESMYRIEKLLNELNEFMPERYIVVCREITKKFEETWRGFPKDILHNFSDKVVKGEFVVVIAPLNWKSKNPI